MALSQQSVIRSTYGLDLGWGCQGRPI